MRYAMLMGLIPAVVITIAVPAYAQDGEEQIQNAADTFASFMANPNQRIPRSVMRQAQGIAIIPNVTTAGFIFGGTGGQALLPSRTQKAVGAIPFLLTFPGAVLACKWGQNPRILCWCL